ncbi:hypothetical protein [Chitinimonas koreensis]|nr:hypothetical protein [Chitinimonas koreensis]QNM94837.1 hypothetical protein H9L41_12925 [Chitinimonas koreensis]
MRTYDKLIATIRTGQGSGGLRPSPGRVPVSSARLSPRIDAATQEDS